MKVLIRFLALIAYWQSLNALNRFQRTIQSKSCAKSFEKYATHRFPSFTDFGKSKLAATEKSDSQDISVGLIPGTSIRGVFAAAKIDPAKPVLTIAADSVIEVTNNRPPTPFPDFVSQSLWESSLWYQRLAYKLLYELIIQPVAEKQSWFAELPQTFSTPLHWSDAQISELQYKAFETKVTQQRTEWRAFYDSFLQQTKSGKQISYDRFIWAMENVNSRAFSGVFEGSSAKERSSLLIFTGFLTVVWPVLGLGSYEQALSAALIVGLSILARDIIFSKSGTLKRYVMCPTIDMFNHRYDNGGSDVSYNYFANSFELRTATAYNPGEQIFISYGKQSNDRLLQFYGFVEENNPFDVYDFGLNPIELLLQIGDTLQSLIPFPSGIPSPEERLKAAARMLSNTEVEDSTFSGEKIKTIKIADKTTRCFRATRSIAGINSANICDRFDELTVRVLRAMYCSADDWQRLGLSTASTLETLVSSINQDTEAKVKAALQLIVKFELESKKTSLSQDVEQLERLNNKSASSSDSSKKGFSNKSTVTVMSKAASMEADPSGSFADYAYSTLAFRIEKKKLLNEVLAL